MNNVQVILGGSFDPFHLGHLQMLRESIDQLSPKYLRVLPCFQQALKSHTAIKSKHRMAMLKLIVKQVNTEQKDKPKQCNVLLDDFEISQNQINYSIKTLTQFSNTFDESLVFLMGEDSILNIQKWKQWEQLLDVCHIAIVKRKVKRKVKQTNKTDKQDLFDCLPQTWQPKWVDLSVFKQSIKNQKAGLICQIEMDYVDISSSFIKTNLNDSQALLPAVIFDYINEHQLYK
ncbi:MAG: nicotinate (nicotinamide) nucleotide adenylyltransferase [Saccharospirillaceae bacterium]|nr:nicotinate (nicotinamide) nucleotide adenylyltransferase [Pseudomonadales bacterium]NRB79897.1 nicotinate (nicotinamide) nucleotide adenylyltransferase [Saccharospirillaceae bacterium]